MRHSGFPFLAAAALVLGGALRPADVLTTAANGRAHTMWSTTLTLFPRLHPRVKRNIFRVHTQRRRFVRAGGRRTAVAMDRGQTGTAMKMEDRAKVFGLPDGRPRQTVRRAKKGRKKEENWPK